MTLTPREHDVIRLVAEGLTDQEIAVRLRVSAHRVAHIVTSIRHKLDAQSRTQAAVIAVRAGLIE